MKQLTSGGKLEWREVADPALQGDGEAVVRALAAEAVAGHGGKLVITR